VRSLKSKVGGWWGQGDALFLHKSLASRVRVFAPSPLLLDRGVRYPYKVKKTATNRNKLNYES